MKHYTILNDDKLIVHFSADDATTLKSLPLTRATYIISRDSNPDGERRIAEGIEGTPATTTTTTTTTTTIPSYRYLMKRLIFIGQL